MSTYPFKKNNAVFDLRNLTGTQTTHCDGSYYFHAPPHQINPQK